MSLSHRFIEKKVKCQTTFLTKQNKMRYEHFSKPFLAFNLLSTWFLALWGNGINAKLVVNNLILGPVCQARTYVSEGCRGEQTAKLRSRLMARVGSSRACCCC